MPAETPQAYRGRFAPSPTGPLHFGSLVTAVASYLQARAQSGEWLVRIEDLDPPRESPTAADAILRALDIHGFEFPAPLYQSSRLEHYEAIINGLLDEGRAYRCACSRRIISSGRARKGPAGLIYPGTCRDVAHPPGQLPLAVRLKTYAETLTFVDAIQGRQSCAIASDIGDFLIRRGDGLIAYQLAVVADDQYQGITEVVRGTDLLCATFMQLWLQKILAYDKPGYAHIPIATDPNGQKLSKQTKALEINSKTPVSNIYQAFVFLDMQPDETLKASSIDDLWAWGTENWRPQAIAGQQKIVDESMILR
ncbi:MAG: tRNA glutamyl-Q(34) synthetase GluQRS [Gammaproteobacteria bacterium]